MTSAVEKKYMSKVAELGCAVCRRMGYEGTPAELHHPRGINVGMGQRSSHMSVLPLCPQHHRGNMGIHGMGRKAFEAHYGFTEKDLFNDLTALLGIAE
jgi:hypothetical protein